MENGAAWLWQGIQSLGEKGKKKQADKMWRGFVQLDIVHMPIFIDFTFIYLFVQFISFIR